MLSYTFNLLSVLRLIKLFQWPTESGYFLYQPAPALPSPYPPNQPFIGQFVGSVVTQGDVWLFAECKDNHWAINGHQKGAISEVWGCDTCLGVWWELGGGGLGRKTNLEFKLHHANAMNWDIKFIALWGVFIWLYGWWAYLSAEWEQL